MWILAYFDCIHTSYKQNEVSYNCDFYNSDLFLSLGENKVSFQTFTIKCIVNKVPMLACLKWSPFIQLFTNPKF